MAKEYKVGERYYLPVAVFTTDARSIDPIGLKYVYTGNGNTGAMYLSDYPDLLLTAEEIATDINTERAEIMETLGKQNIELSKQIEELKSRNAELEALLKEVMATRNEAIWQNDELRKENKNLKAWYDEADKITAERDNLKADFYTQKNSAREWHDKAYEVANKNDELRKENKDLKAAVDKLKDTLVDRTKDVQHLTEENARLKTDLDQRNKDFDAMKKDRDELWEENKKLKADCNDWKDTADERIVDVQNLTAERDNLKADLTTQKKVNEELKAKIAELTEWYMEANRTATEAAEANDELKAKIADLRNRVGEQLAQIQDLNAEVHFHKEFGEGLDKQHKELQARYDELDSVNKEQAEKIRKLDRALADLKQCNDKLRAENTNLTFLLEDAPEKETTKTLHVVLNDGTEIEFRRYTAYDYRTDINMFVVKDGEKYIAGFLRGDKPMNLAYWWTE